MMGIVFYVQLGSNDCGLFAVSFMTSIAHGEDPQTLVYDQEASLTPFPSRKTVTLPRGTMVESIGIHCHCRMPQLPDCEMIECSNCYKWFHTPCSKECMHIIIEHFVVLLYIICGELDDACYIDLAECSKPNFGNSQFLLIDNAQLFPDDMECASIRNHTAFSPGAKVTFARRWLTKLWRWQR